MPGEVDPNNPNGAVAPGGAPPASDNNPNTPDPAAAAGAGGTQVTVPSGAMKRIKEENYNRGMAEAQAAFARDAGFESPAEMQAFMKNLKAQANQPRQPAPVATPPKPAAQQPGGDDLGDPAEDLNRSRQERRIQARADRQMEKIMRERDSFAQQKSDLERQLKEARVSLDSKDAEMALRESAVASGLKDVDYGIRLLTRHLEGKTSAELEVFDDKAFFDGLRKDKPYLFGEIVQPANTGTGVGGAPNPPKPGAAAGAVANGQHPDAKKMNTQEFQEHLRKRNLNVNM